MLTAGPVNAADPTVTFDLTIGPPPATTSFDISFFKNDIRRYILADRKNNAVATGRLACLDTGGKFRADEMAFDPRDDLLIVANDADGFPSLIKTSGTPSIVDQFFYADNDVGKPASARGLSTAGNGIEQGRPLDYGRTNFGKQVLKNCSGLRTPRL
jgi:hypothetical protein